MGTLPSRPYNRAIDSEYMDDTSPSRWSHSRYQSQSPEPNKRGLLPSRTNRHSRKYSISSSRKSSFTSNGSIPHKRSLSSSCKNSKRRRSRSSSPGFQHSEVSRKMIGDRISDLARQWDPEIRLFEQEISKIGDNRAIISMNSGLTNGIKEIVAHQPFSGHFVKKLFAEIHLVLMGDSMFRCQYKDLLYLIVEQNNGPIPENVIQMVFSKTYFGDTLVEWVDRQGTIKYGERVGPGVDDPRLHKEHREYLSEHHWIEYLFVTRIYNDDVERLIKRFEEHPPDVFLIHSSIWDCSRYATDDRISSVQYTLRLSYLCQRLKQVLPPTSLVIFVNMPISAHFLATSDFKDKAFFNQRNFGDGPNNGFLIDKVLTLTQYQASYYTAEIASSYGFDVLDLNYHFEQGSFPALRAKDGIHFNALGVRILTHGILAHIVKAWDIKLSRKIRRKLRELQADYFKEHESEKIPIHTEVPECYRQMFNRNELLWESLSQEHKEKLIEAMGQCGANMKQFVDDPYLKRLLVDLETRIEAVECEIPSNPTSLDQITSDAEARRGDDLGSKRLTHGVQDCLNSCTTSKEDFGGVFSIMKKNGRRSRSKNQFGIC